MLGVGIGIGRGSQLFSGGGGDAFDPDAQAFFIRVTDAGGTLSTTEQNAVNTLVVQMKANGIWTKMKAIYPMVGGGSGTTLQRSAACAQNLKSSSFTGTFTATGWTFASTGITPNNAAYMDSGLNVSTELAANNSHISVYSRTLNLSHNATSIGAFVSQSQEFTLWANHNTLGKLMIHYKYPTGANIVSSTDSRGFFIGNRTSNSSGKLYHDGSLISTNTNTDVGSLPSANVWIGGSQNGTRDVKESAFASIGDGLTDTEASNLYTAVQAFQTTLARQV